MTMSSTGPAPVLRAPGPANRQQMMTKAATTHFPHQLRVSGDVDGCAKENDSKPVTSVMTRLPNGQRLFSCTLCDYTTGQPRLMSAHERVHSDSRPFPCSFCSYRAKRRFEITVHERTHTNEKPLVCPHCDKRFKAHGSLRWHLGHSHVGVAITTATSRAPLQVPVATEACTSS